VLIITSLTALGLAIYCRIFMAPLERFRERVNALGGGLKGIESHFTGVAGELQERVEALEQNTSGQITEARELLQGAAEGQARDLREVRREVAKLQRELQGLQKALDDTAADTAKAAQTAESLAKQLGQFRSDFDALDVELQESVRQLVADSLATVESTVLAALEAIQEEILHGVAEPAGPANPFSTRRGPSKPAKSFEPGAGRGRRENIITVEPLFADLRQKGQQAEPEEPGEGEKPAPEAEGEDES
jgi:hypothetical protein